MASFQLTQRGIMDNTRSRFCSQTTSLPLTDEHIAYVCQERRTRSHVRLACRVASHHSFPRVTGRKPVPAGGVSRQTPCGTPATCCNRICATSTYGINTQNSPVVTQIAHFSWRATSSVLSTSTSSIAFLSIWPIAGAWKIQPEVRSAL